MEERVGKRFSTFCGRGHDERHKQLMLKEVKQGTRNLPTVDEWKTAFKEFLNHYHNSPHPEIKGKTRQQVWDEVEKVEPGLDDYSVLPRATVNVLRGRVRLFNRVFSADFLHQHNGKELVASYDEQDTSISLYHPNGEFLMIATLKSKTHALPTSRVEEASEKRLAGQVKRLNRKIAETQARAAIERTIDVQAIEAVTSDIPVAISDKPVDAPTVDINDFVIEHDAPSQTISPLELLFNDERLHDQTFDLDLLEIKHGIQ